MQDSKVVKDTEILSIVKTLEHHASTLKTVQLIGGGELSDEGTLEEREEVPKGLRFDENGMVVLDNRHKEIPPVQWKHASVERFIWTACRGRFKGTHVPLSLDGRALVRMTPSSLSEAACSDGCGASRAARRRAAGRLPGVQKQEELKAFGGLAAEAAWEAGGKGFL